MTHSDIEQPRPTILDLKATEVREYFMQGRTYCTIELPPYFVFDDLIKKVYQSVDKYEKTNLYKNQTIRKYDDVNYRLLSNKDGKYAWRQLELIHPVIYVLLIKEMTENGFWGEICQRFKKFRETGEHIRCMSIPVVPGEDEEGKTPQVLKWWIEIEQRSIEYALDYEYVIHTDVVDCYPSMYTHSIPWALHSKQYAKQNRGHNGAYILIGNIIDKLIQDMRSGQTNGIPQGSILMDFVAEMILGYADLELAKKLVDLQDYKILRYRDDYRIFANNPKDCDKILKSLAEVMAGLGMRLHPQKTEITDQVVLASIKEDKWGWLCQKGYHKDIQKHLLIIHNHSKAYPNSGSLCRALGNFSNRLKNENLNQIPALISIAVDIAYRNPRTYPYVARIISECLSNLGTWEQKSIIDRIRKRFSKTVNTGLMDIWLQRICSDTIQFEFNEKLCQLVLGTREEIWNNEWIDQEDVRQAVSPESIFDLGKFESRSTIIEEDEFGYSPLMWYF